MRYPALAALLRSAREARGLDQSDVARELGLGQQAVSTWERGQSRPRQNQLSAVAQVLELEISGLRAAGEYDTGGVPAGQPRLRVLPFEQLSDEAFEGFVRDLYRGMKPHWQVTRNGSNGYKQFGVDVFAIGDGHRLGIQCKHEKTFGPEDVRDAIAAVLPEAKVTAGVIALSRPTATPNARLALSGGWSLLDGEDLTTRVRDLAREKQLAIIEQYFPRLRETFLGIKAPSPWLQVEEFEPGLAGRRGYDHQFPMVGRETPLGDLNRLVDDHESVIVVVGRGGIGKTRLLTELAHSGTGREVRFVSRGPVAPESFELLPEGAPVVVLDDALALDTNLVALVSGIRAARKDATVVVSVRPRRLQELLTAMSISAVAARSITVEVGDLLIEDAEQLARSALGEPISDQTVEQLARAGYDCPLLIVVGAHLIREGHLEIARLSSNADLRAEILTQYADVATTGEGGETRRSVLSAIATLQPVRLDHADFLTALVDLTKREDHEVLQALDELEDLGVVMRRGQSVRIVPDLLGDALLERVLVSRSGVATSWPDRVARLVRGDALANSIRNVSVLDWYRRGGEESQLADSLWASLERSVLKSSNSERIQVVGGIQAVATIYADRALNIAEAIMQNPAPDEEDEVSRLWGGKGVIAAVDANRTLSELITNASQDPSQLGRGMALLFSIGKNDARQEHQTPSHAMRLLRELGEYRPERPVSFNLAYVDTVGNWLADEAMRSDRALAVGLLKPSLAVDVTVFRSRGPSISFSRLPVNMDAVGSVRQKSIELAGTQLRADARTALAAIAVLEEALRAAGKDGPINEELERVHGLLENALSDPSIAASVRLSAYRALGWQATYGLGEVRARARSIRHKIVVDFDLRVARLMRSGWMHDDDDDEDDTSDFETSAVNRYQRSVEWSQREAGQIVEELVGETDDLSILDRLLNLMRDEQAATGTFQSPDALLSRLVIKRPGVGKLAIDSPLADDADEAAKRVALASLLATDDQTVDELAIGLLRVGPREAVLVARAVASIGGAPVTPRRERVLTALVELGDPFIWRLLLGSARWWEQEDRQLLLNLIRRAPVDKDSELAEVVAELLCDGRILGWIDLPVEDQEALLDRFVQTPSLDAYDFARLLNLVIRDRPMRAISFLEARVDASVDRERSYDALPFSWHQELVFKESVLFPDVLAHVVEWLITGETWQRSMHGSALFQQVAGTYDAQVLAVLLDLVRAGDEQHLRLFSELVHHADTHFVIRESAFVEIAIKAGQDLGETEQRLLLRGLHGTAIYGARSRSIGEDDPDEIALRDGARGIAGRLPEGSRIRSFYDEVADLAEQRIQEERRDDRTLYEPRRW